MSKPYSMMDSDERQEWADDHGYVRYRCPVCHRIFHSDSGPEGQCCPDEALYCHHCMSEIDGRIIWENDLPYCRGCRPEPDEDDEQ